MAKKINDDQIEQVETIQDICIDLLETLTMSLTYITNYAEENNIQLQESFYNKIQGTLGRAIKLLEELGLSSPNLKPYYSKSIRRIYTDKKPDEDYTVPRMI